MYKRGFKKSRAFKKQLVKVESKEDHQLEDLLPTDQKDKRQLETTYMRCLKNQEPSRQSNNLKF